MRLEFRSLRSIIGSFTFKKKKYIQFGNNGQFARQHAFDKQKKK